jgi:hypothetical protein
MEQRMGLFHCMTVDGIEDGKKTRSSTLGSRGK